MYWIWPRVRAIRLSRRSAAFRRFTFVVANTAFLHCPQAMRQLIEDCWAADAEKRPTFEEVISRLEAQLARLPKHQHFEKDAACMGCNVQ